MDLFKKVPDVALSISKLYDKENYITTLNNRAPSKDTLFIR